MPLWQQVSVSVPVVRRWRSNVGWPHAPKTSGYRLAGWFGRGWGGLKKRARRADAESLEHTGDD